METNVVFAFLTFSGISKDEIIVHPRNHRWKVIKPIESPVTKKKNNVLYNMLLETGTNQIVAECYLSRHHE